MLELLCEELGKVGLQLNGAKPNILTNCVDASAASVHVNGEEVEIYGNIEIRCCPEIFGPKIFL